MLSHLRLTAFKSFLGQSLELRPLTLLVGPNASGKSNVIDALSLLALLADERSLADLERGDETVAGLRGGITGAAPFGDPTVKIGCTVSRGDEKYDLDLTLDAGPAPEVIDERLVRRDARGRVRELLHGQRQESGSGILDVDVYSGGAPRRYTMLSARPATVQPAGFRWIPQPEGLSSRPAHISPLLCRVCSCTIRSLAECVNTARSAALLTAGGPPCQRSCTS